MSASGNYEEARRYFERAIEIWETSLGPDHPAVAQTYGNLARMMFEQKNYRESIPLLERALAIEEKAFGGDSALTVVTRTNLARALLGTDQPRAARPHAERALELAAASDVPASERAVAEEALARVLWALGEHQDALSHGRAAAEAFSAAPDSYDRSAAAMREWVAERDR
jgi:tetratricopeptide (TPR) repeat protein